MSDTLDQSVYMTTFSGVRFTMFDPQVDQINLEDIAQALSMLCRFTGHVTEFYSVAQHSVMVSRLLPAHLAFQGLLHDAQEAYINDLSRPVKHHPGMSAYRDLEQRLERTIRLRFGLPEKLDPLVKRVDDLIVVDEARRLLSPVPEWTTRHPRSGVNIDPWSPQVARGAFLWQFQHVTKPTTLRP